MLDPVSGPQPPAPAQPDQGPSALSSDFETFLTMLTTQMQNQNPLEPTPSSDFAVQLATFSGVEQQVQTNDLLTELRTQMGLSELAGWVGREALSEAPISIDGSPRTLVLPELDGAQRAELVISDTSGTELQRVTIDPALPEITFDPADAPDGPLPDGQYRFSVEGYRDGEPVGAAPALGYARINEARSDAGQTLLVLEGGQIVNSRDVVGLRDGRPDGAAI